MSIKVYIDNKNEIEIASSDLLDGPGSSGLGGWGKAWYRINEGDWKVSRFRSQHECVKAADQLNVEDAIEAIRDYD